MDRFTLGESQPWTYLPWREPAMDRFTLMRESQPWTDLSYERETAMDITTR